MFSQDKYLKAMDFAAVAHGNQQFPGKPYSYMVHPASVAMEILGAHVDAAGRGAPFDFDLAVQCALLHDTIEDAGVTFERLREVFGLPVAEGVLALSKDSSLPKSGRMSDSLRRISQQPKEVWMVKLADRICNLQEPPPYWSNEKRMTYQKEAGIILETLRDASDFLAGRLEHRISEYSKYITE